MTVLKTPEHGHNFVKRDGITTKSNPTSISDLYKKTEKQTHSLTNPNKKRFYHETKDFT